MKKWLFFCALIVCSLLSSISFPAAIAIFNTKPDFMMISIVFINIYYRRRDGMLCAVCAGFLKDSVSFSRFGISILSLCVCAYAAQKLKRYFYKDRFLEQAVFMLAVSFLGVLIFSMGDILFAQPSLFLPVLGRGIIQSIFTAVISPVAFMVIKKCVPKYFV